MGMILLLSALIIAALVNDLRTQRRRNREAFAFGREAGKRDGYEEAYVEVWNALFHGGSLAVPGPRGSQHEGSTVIVEGGQRRPITASGNMSLFGKHDGAELPMDKTKLN